MTPVGGIVRLGTPVSRAIHGSNKQHDLLTLDGPYILSGLCDSKLWVIKCTENPLDTNIPIIKRTWNRMVKIISNGMQLRYGQNNSLRV